MGDSVDTRADNVNRGQLQVKDSRTAILSGRRAHQRVGDNTAMRLRAVENCFRIDDVWGLNDFTPPFGIRMGPMQ